MRRRTTAGDNKQRTSVVALCLVLRLDLGLGPGLGPVAPGPS